MATESQGRSGTSASHETLTEQEMQELDTESIQNEIEAETENEAEIESEACSEEIETEATESLEMAEGFGHGGSQRFRGILARFFLRQMIRAVLVYTKAVVRRMHRSATLRRKLLAASRRGPRAVRALVGLAVLRAMPKPFRRASRRLLPLVIGLSFRFIARHAGLSANEADSAELESEAT